MIVAPKDSIASASPTPSAKERAIAKFNSNGQSSPVANPSQVAIEELSAIKAPSEGQNNTSEDTSPEKKAASSEAEKQPAKDEAPLSAQYAQLARKEKALRAKVQEIKAQEATFKAQEEQNKSLQERIAKLESLEKKLSEDPFSVLLDRGITYDQLTQRALNAPSPEEVVAKSNYDKLQAQIAKIQEAQENSAKLFAEQQTQQYNQAVNQIRGQAKQLIESDANFETVKETNSIEDVVDLIKQTFEKDGVLMTVEEAALAVEEHLVEEAMKLARLSKIQQRMKPATQPSAPKQPDETKQQPTKTLTNAVTSSRALTSKERAILAFNGKLNK